ncbi:TonB-dependent receptor [Zobellia galactanivorans]|uniref:SusC/RagA family TonB-linked outer membrane protein n=1 Tax=Zobellia galactanivorans (strain DSM 12802 / CCUG 47099 / CIP 106680 / NCIMB 13871 / Dsij) TaxID=63186 RepID=UPI0026E19FCD|nr:TonB-dependent receptor [Zobellia galactanivorans]MDO6809949.1 TonB-dependent receptor [Zobellia galactanivorans]
MRTKITFIRDPKLLAKQVFTIFFLMLFSSQIYAAAIGKTTSLLKKETFNYQASVSGTIVDEASQPLPGVSIVIKGTSTGVSTDFDGNYSLIVDKSDVLLISYIGFVSQEITVGDQSTINVVMVEDVSKLDEVVVVGYGTQKKSDLTGSVASADLQAFEDQPNVNILQSLQGSVAGLNIGAVSSAGENPNIQVRGRNTFAVDDDGNLTGSDPLIVLDGVIYRGSLADINPADIGTIDVLKDASSQAIYGSQAANGVILITSKSGKTNRKPVINFSSFYSVETPTNTLTPVGRDGFLEHYNKIFYEEAYLAPEYTQLDPTFDPSARFPYQSILDGFNNGTNTDWLDVVSQSAHTQNTNISMAGNSGKTSYFLSSGYIDQKGWLLNDQFDRLSLRANFDTKVRDWLTIGMQTFASFGDYSGLEADLRRGYMYSPLIAPFNEDGSIATDPIGAERSPLLRTAIDQLDKRLNLFGNFYAQVQLPIKGLSYRINHAINYRTQRDFRFDPIANNFAGAASKENIYREDRTTDNLLTYKQTFNEKHDLDVTLLYGFEERNGESTIAQSGNFLNQALGVNSLESGDVDLQLAESDAFDERSIYQMARLNYRYNNKYLLTFTTRRDGFSGFGSDKKFGIFPSLGLAWTISNEKFIADAMPGITNLKLRATYGQTGNRTVGRYRTLARVDAGFQYVFGDGSGPAYGQNISSLANNSLSWETTTGLNLGLDFGFLDGKINGSVNYYDTITEDILFDINLPRITGFETIPTNLGEVANNGLEASVTSINVQTDNFTWTSTLNFSTNSNEIITILGRDDDNDGVEDDLITTRGRLIPGQSIQTIYDYVDTGVIYQLNDNIPDGYNPGNRIFEDLDGDGLISADKDRKVLGRAEEAYRFSIYNEFNYKNFTFSAFINSIQGGKDGYLGRVSPTSSIGILRHDNASTYNTFKEFDAWSPANPKGIHSGVLFDDPIAAQRYADRSFVRLQDVRLAYNFPDKIVEKLAISKLRLFLTGKNLHTWTDWIGTDPEINGNAFDLNQAPVMKSYSLGLNLTF